MTKLELGAAVTYGEHEVGKYQIDIQYRIKELKQKVVDKTITEEEKEELKLLVA